MTGLISVAGSTPSDTGFELKSVRYDGPGSNNGTSYLTKTFPAGGNQKTWTLSVWVKKSGVNVGQQNIICPTGTPESQLGFNGDYLHMYEGGSVFNLRTMEVFRDPSAWYHIVVAVDTTEAIEANRIKMYSNNRLITVFNSPSEDNYPAQDTSLKWNAAVEHAISKYGHTTGAYFVGYMAEFYWIDGYQLTPSSFAATNELTNQWQPLNPVDIKPTLTFGTTGFYLPFSNDALATSFTDSAETSIVTFTSSGTTTWTAPSGCTSVDYLVVAGGGGGGNGKATAQHSGGGGGAGGVRSGTSFSVTPGTSYTVTVGAGGAGNGANGSDSVFSTITSTGGGYGGTNHGAGASGGSGGGGAAGSGSGGAASPVTDPVQGYAGSSGTGDNASGGGGGASEVGQTAGPGDYPGGAGGDGVSSSISGSAVTYGGGGGGAGLHYTPAGGAGGAGGGGAGATYNGGATIAATAGTANTGGGGGGGTYQITTGAAGGSGIVILDMNVSEPPRHAITVNGDTKNVRLSTTPFEALNDIHIIGPKIGSSSLAFYADGSYLSFADSDDFNLSDQPFTWEAWVYPVDRGTGTWGTLMEHHQSSSERTYLRIENQVNGVHLNRYEFEIDNSGTNFSVNSDFAPNYYHWQHVAVCRVGDVFTMYVDGVAQSTPVTNSLTINNRSASFLIGQWTGSNTSGDWLGYMQMIRFSNVARYTSNFTPPAALFTSDASTVFLIQSNTTMGSTTITDSGPDSRTVNGTASGVKHVANKIGTGMSQGYKTGGTTAADAIRAPLVSKGLFDVWEDGSDWTLEAWVCVNDVPSGSEYWTWIGGYEDDDNKWTVGYDQSSSNGLWWYMRKGGSTVVDHYSGSDGLLTDTNWHHVAFTKTGSGTHTLKAYFDGTEVMDTTDDQSDTFAGYLNIGCIHATAGGFPGFMDEVRISNTVRYTGTFTPSTTAFKDDKNTVLLLHMDGGGGIDPETNLPTIDPGQGTYFWDASTDAIFYDAAGAPTNKSIINFDGTGDYFTVPPSSDFSFGTGSYTWEAWVYMNPGATGADFFWDQRKDQSNGIYVLWRDTGLIETGTGDPPVQSSTDAVVHGQWYHVAVVRNGSSAITIYVNGISVGTGTLSTDIDTSSTANYIGSGQAAPENPLNGKMDQVRISNIARYTSAFTPPTEPFTTDANTMLLLQSDWSEGGLGADHSENYNYWTPTNLGVDDMMPDSPMNNFCTWNAADKRSYNGSNATLAEGNLKGTTSSGYGGAASTFLIPPTRKWYAEFYIDVVDASGDLFVGLFDSTTMWTVTKPYDNPVKCGCYRDDGLFIYTGGNNTSTDFATFDDGDIIGVAVDMDNDKLWVSKNNVWQGENSPNPSTNTAGYSLPINVDYVYSFGNGTVSNSAELTGNWGQDSSFHGETTAQGYQDANDKGDFYYAPPTGFLALCTDNLSAPNIALPGENFNTSPLYG